MHPTRPFIDVTLSVSECQ